MKGSELNWIVEKASELLYDKVEEGPLDDDDVELAYSIFAEPRLMKISYSFDSQEDFSESTDHVRKKLHEVAHQLNDERWPEEEK